MVFILVTEPGIIAGRSRPNPLWNQLVIMPGTLKNALKPLCSAGGMAIVRFSPGGAGNLLEKHILYILGHSFCTLKMRMCLFLLVWFTGPKKSADYFEPNSCVYRWDVLWC